MPRGHLVTGVLASVGVTLQVYKLRLDTPQSCILFSVTSGGSL